VPGFGRPHLANAPSPQTCAPDGATCPLPRAGARQACNTFCRRPVGLLGAEQMVHLSWRTLWRHGEPAGSRVQYGMRWRRRADVHGGTNNVPGDRRCRLEPPLVAAASCALRFRVNRWESGFATVSPVSAARAVCLQRWRASPLPIRSSARRPITFALVTKGPSLGSVSALAAAQRYSTRKRVANNRPWRSPSAPWPIQVFRHLKIRSTTVANIPGFSHRWGYGATTRIPASSASARWRPTLAGTPDAVSAKSASACCLAPSLGSPAQAACLTVCGKHCFRDRCHRRPGAFKFPSRCTTFMTLPPLCRSNGVGSVIDREHQIDRRVFSGQRKRR
jgi:hypothetical protein